MAFAENEFAARQNPEEGPRHNCGVAAFYFNTPRPLSNLIPALTALNHRGQEGVGVVGFLPDKTISSYRHEGIVRDNTDGILSADAEVIIALGHDRYSTSGGMDAWQPFCDEGDRIATAHNGNITNPLSLLGEVPDSEQSVLVSDTHVLHKALNAHPEQSVEERLQAILPKVEGAYSLTIADRETEALYLVRDPWGFRPLHYAPLKDGSGYMAGSETVAFTQFAHDDAVIEVQPGQCIRIDAAGISEIAIEFPEIDSARCIFELVYLGSPASEIFGTQVNRFRKDCGSALAKDDILQGFIPDVVVPVRDSGAAAANGYSASIMQHLIHEGHTPESVTDRMPQEGLLRNNYVNRTFILPEGRGDAVAEKFTVVPEVVRGKKIVLVDDSVVRGTTMTKLVRMMRNAGALEVHVRSAAPPIRHGCYYGVDFTNEKDELIAEGRTEADIADAIGADSIGYIKLTDMVHIASELSGRANGFCTACFDGNYPVPIDQNLLLGKSC